MNEPTTTHEALESLTPEQLDVLRRRFGFDGKDEDSTSSGDLPPFSGGGEDDNGSGGVPAPADPPW